MEQKQVKIIGLSLNAQMGILQACKMKFDATNKLITNKNNYDKRNQQHRNKEIRNT